MVCTYLRNEVEIDVVSSLVRTKNELFECRLASRRLRALATHQHEGSYSELCLGTLREKDEPVQVQDFNAINSLPYIKR